MPLAIRLRHGARRPETRRFQQDLRASIEEERVVARRAPGLPHGIGDIGADVVLHPAGEDVDHLAIGTHHALGRGLLAGVSRFPRVQRAFVADRICLGARAGQRVIAIHQHRARRLWPSRRVEGQQIGLGIPEHVAEIRITGQAARADRHSVRLPGWQR